MSPQAARDAARFAGNCFFLGVVLTTCFLLGHTFGSASVRPDKCTMVLAYQHYTTELTGAATYYNGAMTCSVNYGGVRL